MPKRLNIEDYRGKKYGKLTILDFYINNHTTYAICKCDCGNIHKARVSHIKSNKILSCGCLQKEMCKKCNTTHAKRYSRIYAIWCGIKSRCTNKNRKNYKNYGGRGITICEEWINDFINFYNWSMANGYRDDLTIDRIDVNGNYEPSNCRWVTMEIQAINKRIKNKYGINGICWNKRDNKFQVDIGVKGKIKHLGYYKTLEEAIKARKEAEKLYFEPLLSIN